MTRHHHHAHEHKHHDRHGNPEDLREYVGRLEDPAREEWQQPDRIIQTLGLDEKVVVCDVGAGPGYFALRIPGPVFAIEVETRIAEVLLERIRERKVRHVTPVLALPDDPLVPDASCDVVLIINAFHHFPDPVAYLRRLVRALKPGGRIVNIDFHKRELPVGPPVDNKIDRAEFVAVAKQAGLRVRAEHDFLPHQYFLELVPE